MRHPAIEKDLVIEYSSTAHSLAPSAWRIDGGCHPSKPSSWGLKETPTLDETGGVLIGAALFVLPVPAGGEPGAIPAAAIRTTWELPEGWHALTPWKRTSAHSQQPLSAADLLDNFLVVGPPSAYDSFETKLGDTVVTGLLGGTPQSVPERYAQASAMRLVPLGVRQVLMWGEHEAFVPLPLAQAYADAASRAGDAVRVTVVPRVGHFDLASPTTAAWPALRSAIRALLDGRLPE